jgi:hypothetical protein
LLRNRSLTLNKECQYGRLSVPNLESDSGPSGQIYAELAGVKPNALKQIHVGQPTGDSTRDALVCFVRKLAQSSGTVSDEDFAVIKAAGCSDAQLVAAGPIARGERKGLNGN